MLHVLRQLTENVPGLAFDAGGAAEQPLQGAEDRACAALGLGVVGQAGALAYSAEKVREMRSLHVPIRDFILQPELLQAARKLRGHVGGLRGSDPTAQ